MLILFDYLSICGFNTFISVLQTISKLYSIFILFISVLLFRVFEGLKIQNNKVINIIASTTFGVYLIHDSDLGRYVFWEIIINSDNFLKKDFIIYTILMIVFVFVVSSTIELIRYKIFKLIEKKTNNKLCNVIINNIEKLI